MLALPGYLGLFLGDDAARPVQAGPFLHAFVWLIAVPLAMLIYAAFRGPADFLPFEAGAQWTFDNVRAVFTDPEIGMVGLTEAEAEAQGIDCRCQSLDLSYVPKAAAVRDTRGVVNMVIERESHKILGVHLIAPRGADIIHEAALAVRFGLTIEDLIETIHVYPTMSEAIRMVAQMFFKDVGKLSCCAE